MFIKVILIVIGLFLLICGIVFIVKKIGGNGTNKVKILGIEFESNNGTAALILFFGFAMIIIGARLEAKEYGQMSGNRKRNEKAANEQGANADNAVLSAFELGKNAGEVMWYEYRFKQNRTGSVMQQLPIEFQNVYNSKVAFADLNLKELNIEIRFDDIDKRSHVNPEVTPGIGDLEDLIEKTNGERVKLGFRLGYYVQLFWFRAVHNDVSGMPSEFQGCIALVDGVARELDLPQFPNGDYSDASGNFSNIMLRLQVEKYMDSIEMKLKERTSS